MDEILALINSPIEEPHGQRIVLALKLSETEEVNPDGESEIYLENRDAGIEIHLDRRRIVRVVLLYADGYEGAKQYPGPLLQELTFASNRAEVLDRLGTPSKSIDGSNLAFLGEIGTIDRYLIGEHVVQFQFRVGDDGIDVITLASPDHS